MTTAPPTSAPLEANDPERARALKAKIRDRMSDVRRHLLALRAAMAEFGEDFELDTFCKAYASEELRRMLVHEYATVTAEQVHESCRRELRCLLQRVSRVDQTGVPVRSRLTTETIWC